MFFLSQKHCFSVSFDESFNKVIQEEQMDLLVRYWDDEVKEVVTRYFGSEFLGHTRAGDLRDKFLKGLSPLNQANMVQVSMDGPSTNWKFYEELVKLRDEQDPDIPLQLNLVPAACMSYMELSKQEHKKTGWGH